MTLVVGYGAEPVVIEVYREDSWTLLDRGGFELSTSEAGWELKVAGGEQVAPPWRVSQGGQLIAANEGVWSC